MNKLKEIRKRKGLGQVEIAKMLGIGQSSYSRYEAGLTNIPVDILTKLSGILETSSDELLGISETKAEQIGRPIQIDYTPVPDAEVMVPVVASLRCGYGTSGEPYTFIGRKPVPASMFERWGKEIVLCEAVGSSMLPTIRPGEYMVCYPGDWWDDGMVVIVNVNDSDTVKRIYHAEDGGIDLVPDNSKFKSVHYTPQDVSELQIQVLAHVLTTLPQDIRSIPRRKE